MSGTTATERALMAALAAATALAGLAHYLHWTPVLSFALAGIALAGLAWLISFATEQVGERTGPAVTGLLQSSLGNLPELLVIIFALEAGERAVAETAIIGSLLANALLVLGLVIVVGAHTAKDGVMRFSRGLPRDTATLMLVTVFIIVVVGVGLHSGGPVSSHVKTISVVAAACLLAVYIAWVIPYVRRDAAVERPAGGARISLPAALLLLGAAGVGSAFSSDWFVDALAPAITRLHLTREFAGLVIVAVAGNAVENVVGLVLARRGRSDLAISVVKNSVAQVAAFLWPLLVLISLMLSTQLTFAIAPVYIGAIALTAILMWQVTADGEAAAYEGWALAGLYVVVAIVALYR